MRHYTAASIGEGGARAAMNANPIPHARAQHASLLLAQDMTQLAFLHEPGVLHNLQARYEQRQVYTYTGSILIAINPFQPLPHLYGPAAIDQYRAAQRGQEELPPHVYATACAAYRSMLRDGTGQAILVGVRWARKRGKVHFCAPPVEGGSYGIGGILPVRGRWGRVGGWVGGWNGQRHGLPGSWNGRCGANGR